MNINFKLDDTVISISATYNRELHIDLNTNIDDLKAIFNAIYEVVNIDELLDDDQIDEIKDL